MASCEKLRAKAENSPTNLRFTELCKLAECWGYEFSRQKGSHRIFRHNDLKLPNPHALQNFQDDDGKAKMTQIEQLLAAIEFIREHHLTTNVPLSIGTMPFPNYGFDVRWSERDEAFLATCPSFPTLSAFGPTRQDALHEAEVVLELLVEEYQEQGVGLPASVEAIQRSGQLRVRLPRSLHVLLANRADTEGVSLNQFIVHLLSWGIGWGDGSHDVQLATSETLSQFCKHFESLLDHQEMLFQTQVDFYRGHAAEVNVLGDSAPQDPLLRHLMGENSLTLLSK